LWVGARRAAAALLGRLGSAHPRIRTGARGRPER
jgi:hypothetical protein